MRPFWTRRSWVLAPLAYRAVEEPWQMPPAWHAAVRRLPRPLSNPYVIKVGGLPVLPLVLYLRAGDRALFWLWWWSRPAVWWLADTWGVDPVVKSWSCQRCMHSPLRRASGATWHADPCGVPLLLGRLPCRCREFIPSESWQRAMDEVDRQARAAETATLSAPAHVGHGCAIDPGREVA